MEDRTRAAGAASDQASWEEEVNQKLGEAIIQVEALMRMKAKFSETSTISSPVSYAKIAHLALLLCRSEIAREASLPVSYAKIAHLALLLCRSEIAREASLDTTPIDSSLEAAHPGGKWSKWRAKQHREVRGLSRYHTDRQLIGSSPSRRQVVQVESKATPRSYNLHRQPQ
eukprot:s693_g7.t1